LGETPADYNHEEMEELIEGQMMDDEFYGIRSRRIHPHNIALDFVRKLNPDQRYAFNVIQDAITSEGGDRLFFVEGAGGTGAQTIFSLVYYYYNYIN
jgi:hypothetical protein